MPQHLRIATDSYRFIPTKKLKPELMESAVRRAFIEVVGLREARIPLAKVKEIPSDNSLDYDKMELQAVGQAGFKIKPGDLGWEGLIRSLTGNLTDGHVKSMETIEDGETQPNETEVEAELASDGHIKSVETVKVEEDQPREAKVVSTSGHESMAIADASKTREPSTTDLSATMHRSSKNSRWKRTTLDNLGFKFTVRSSSV